MIKYYFYNKNRYKLNDNIIKKSLMKIEENIETLTPDETAVVMWSLCIQDIMTNELWHKLCHHIGHYKIKDMDEATYLHLVQVFI